MTISQASIKRKVEALEARSDGSNDLKIFIYHHEADVPFWEPEDPANWQKLHPNGKAILLEARDCGSEDDNENF